MDPKWASPPVTPAAFEGATWSLSRFISPEETREFTAALREVVERGVMRNVVLNPRSASGEVIPTSLNASALRDPDGRAIGVIGILRDMRELDKARAYAESLIKNAPDPVFVSDLEGKILQANDAVFALAIDNSERTGILSTPGCEIKINDGGWIIALNGDMGTFGGNAKVSLSGVSSGNQEYHDHGPLQPLTVKTIDVQAVACNEDRTEASLFGNATVDGEGSYEYQIDLKDAGEPGVNDTYRIFIPGVAYESGPQTLRGGNVQIR